ncbi:hypothetical protein [Hymenobacter lucidus]|uniref:T9SS-like galactose binding domain-containing protein n=1 Tax=Hymenobacter lucidus TaxID=2880930 RepID=A0ABS8AMZ0_9BACT|nr:hypothetical protein [Hymenobacter lucidus]MCB2407575.1 hypothetical protein [Hymenobacter lucidus]
MEKKYSWLILLSLLLLAGPASRAQLLLGYQFQAQSSPYVPLGTGATRLPVLEADEALANKVPLGFTFVMGGRFYTDAAVSSNGWLGLTPTVLQYPSPSSSGLLSGGGGNSHHTIAPLWADLDGQGGSAWYQTTGAAPNRVFTMEWREYRWDRLATQPVVSFQARLYEGSNRIEFSYRAEAGSVSSGSGSYTSDARAGLTILNYSTGLHSPIMIGGLGTAPQLNPADRSGTLVKPATGQLYQFSPTPNTIPACAAPYYSVLGRLGQTTARVDWSINPQVASGIPRVHYGPRGFVLGSAADRIAPGLPGDSAHLTGLVPDTDYEFLVETDCGTTTAPGRTSRTAFRTYTPPSNDEGHRALWLPVLGAQQQAYLTPGFTENASTSLPASTSCTQPAGRVRDVWYAFRATEANHRVVVSTGGQPGTFVLELRNGYGGSSQAIACATSPTPMQVGGLVPGQPYFIRVYPLTSYSYFEVGVLSGSSVPPANDNCANAQLLPVASEPGGLPPASGTVRNATPSNLGPGGIGSCGLGGGASKDVFYQFVAPGPGAEVQFAPAFQAGVDVMSSCGGAQSNYQNCMLVPGGKLGRLALTGLTPGATYFLRVYNQQETVVLQDATFSISVSAPASAPANDACAGALPLPVTPPAVVGATGTLLGATSSGVQPPTTLCYAAPSSGNPYTAPSTARDVWYQFTATAPRHALQLHSTCDAVLEVMSTSGGTPCASSATVQRLACALARATDPNYVGAAPPLPGRLLLNDLVVGDTYWVRVFELSDPTAIRPAGKTSFTLSLNAWEVPANDEPAQAVPVTPSATQQPCAASVQFSLDGATPTFPAASGNSWTERDVWFSFVAPPAPAGKTYATVILRLGEDEEHMLHGGVQLREGTTATSAILAADGWSSAIRLLRPGFSYTRLTPGTTYYLRFFSSLPNPEPLTRFSFCFSTGINDEPCDAVPLPLSATGQCLQPVQGTTFAATKSTINAGLRLPVPNCGDGTASAYDVWYSVVPTTTAFTLHTDDVTVGLARLYQPVAGSCSGAMQLVSCQSSHGAANQRRALGTVFFDNLTAGQTYYLAVSNSGSGLDPIGPFTLCGQTGITLPTRAKAVAHPLNVWPNPVAIGEQLQVRLPDALPLNTRVRVEWLSTLGQTLPEAGEEHAAADGVLHLTTAGRAAGLYLLRLWLPSGQPLPVHRVFLR